MTHHSMRLQDQPFSPTQRLRWGIGTLMLCLSMTVHAANADWWIDIANDRVQDIKSQLALGEDPNVMNDKGQPALMQAIQDGAWGTYDLLVSHRNIDINISNKEGETPLMYLAIVGDVPRATALIKRGAEVNRLGWTPLHYAASKGQLEMVQLLLANGALVNAPAPDGTTPLMMAAFSGKEAVVRALLKAGADVTTRNLSQLDAADWAESKNYTKLAAKLRDHAQKVQAQRDAQRAAAEANQAQSFPIGPRASDVTETRGDTDGTVERQANASQGPSSPPQEPVTTVEAGDKPWYERFRTDKQSAVTRKAEPVSDTPLDEEPVGSPSSRYFDLDRFKD